MAFRRTEAALALQERRQRLLRSGHRERQAVYHGNTRRSRDPDRIERRHGGGTLDCDHRSVGKLRPRRRAKGNACCGWRTYLRPRRSGQTDLRCCRRRQGPLGRVAGVPTPILRDGCVYVTAGYGVGCKLVKLGAGNQVSDVYDNKAMKNHHGGVLLVGDHLYGYSDGPGWLCQEFKSGKEVWSEK